MAICPGWTKTDFGTEKAPCTLRDAMIPF